MAHVKMIRREDRDDWNDEPEEDVWDGVPNDEKTNSLISDQLNKAIDNITDAIADERASKKFVSAEEQAYIRDIIVYIVKEHSKDYL